MYGNNIITPYMFRCNLHNLQGVVDFSTRVRGFPPKKKHFPQVQSITCLPLPPSLSQKGSGIEMGLI